MSLRPVKAERLIKVLVDVGFKPVRRRGSHVILRHDDGRVTVVPVHGVRRSAEGCSSGFSGMLG